MPPDPLWLLCFASTGWGEKRGKERGKKGEGGGGRC
jgi:hypothetical protein